MRVEFLTPLRGFSMFGYELPTTYVVGYILSPLRGFHVCRPLPGATDCSLLLGEEKLCASGRVVELVLVGIEGQRDGALESHSRFHAGIAHQGFDFGVGHAVLPAGLRQLSL